VGSKKKKIEERKKVSSTFLNPRRGNRAKGYSLLGRKGENQARFFSKNTLGSPSPRIEDELCDRGELHPEREKSQS